MLTALAVSPVTIAISRGASCSHAQSVTTSRSRAGSAVERGEQLGMVLDVRPRERRVEPADPLDQAQLAAGTAVRVGEAAPGDGVRPGQRVVGGYVVQPAPQHQERVREHVVDGMAAGARRTT